MSVGAAVIGADTQHLADHARLCDTSATQLRALATKLDRTAASVVWTGPDRERFEQEWTRQHAPSLKAAVTLLERQAALLREHASEQEAASSERSLSHGIGEHYLLYSESGDGREARVFGDLEHATKVAIIVPGMNTEHDDVNANARQLYESMVEHAEPGERVAVVTGLVYDTPEGADGALTGTAYDARDDVQSLVHDVNALAPHADVSVVAHSYGSVVTGATMRSSEGLDVATVVAIGSPGMTADSRADLKSPDVEVWAGATASDFVPHLPSVPSYLPVVGPFVEAADSPFASIPFVGGLFDDVVSTIERNTLGTSVFDHATNFGFGNAPTSSDFGANVFDTGGASGHSEYFTDPGSVGNISRIVLGQEPES